MRKIIFIALLLIVQTPHAAGQIWLSPVNTGDCVAARIRAKKTSFVRELDKKYCAQNLPDKAKESVCLKNTRLQDDFSFFTDRCSEGDYFIGINGKEVQLRRISKSPGKPIDFIGSFAGKGFNVEINLLRPLKKAYRADQRRNEDDVEGGVYDVFITVKKGAHKKTFNGVLMYGL